MRRVLFIPFAGLAAAALLGLSAGVAAQDIQWVKQGDELPPQPRGVPSGSPSGGMHKGQYRGSPSGGPPARPVGPAPVKPAPKVSQPPAGPRPGPAPQPPVVAPGWPIKRPLNPVTVRPRYNDHYRHDDRHRHDDRYPYAYPYPYYYGSPFFYLPLVVFGGYYVARWDDRAWGERLRWEDAITIYDDEGWVEFTLDCGARGEKLWIEVRDGRSRFDWAEVVFEDGMVQVVEFADRSLGPGLYSLLEFHDRRRVDFVRMVARATTREARLILRLER